MVESVPSRFLIKDKNGEIKKHREKPIVKELNLNRLQQVTNYLRELSPADKSVVVTNIVLSAIQNRAVPEQLTSLVYSVLTKNPDQSPNLDPLLLFGLKEMLEGKSSPLFHEQIAQTPAIRALLGDYKRYSRALPAYLVTRYLLTGKRHGVFRVLKKIEPKNRPQFLLDVKEVHTEISKQIHNQSIQQQFAERMIALEETITQALRFFDSMEALRMAELNRLEVATFRLRAIPPEILLEIKEARERVYLAGAQERKRVKKEEEFRTQQRYWQEKEEVKARPLVASERKRAAGISEFLAKEIMEADFETSTVCTDLRKALVSDYWQIAKFGTEDEVFVPSSLRKTILEILLNKVKGITSLKLKPFSSIELDRLFQLNPELYSMMLFLEKLFLVRNLSLLKEENRQLRQVVEDQVDPIFDIHGELYRPFKRFLFTNRDQTETSNESVNMEEIRLLSSDQLLRLIAISALNNWSESWIGDPEYVAACQKRGVEPIAIPFDTDFKNQVALFYPEGKIESRSFLNDGQPMLIIRALAMNLPFSLAPINVSQEGIYEGRIEVRWGKDELGKFRGYKI